MTHTEYYNEIKKQFPLLADQELISRVNEGQKVTKKLLFNKFYHLYQALHLEKYGEYLQIQIEK